ncbi:type II secretion system protein [Marmoricola sp. RAF53]|uniref:type II secretion system protein n=1 Tax=Marmoricola sp. RAF53 TaxID=3233059 RepID=UPI003F9DF028
MQDPRAAARGDRGETLVEVLVAVVILGIAGAAVMAGLQLSVKASDIHRKETTGGAYVRSLAEAIEQYVGKTGTTNYKPCAAANAYLVGSVTSTLDLPSGYTATQDAAKSVNTAGAASTCNSDTGVQQVTLRIASSDSRATEKLVVILRKPCDPSVAACT